MLLSFKVSNYKSFKDEMVFSMTAAPKQKGLDYSLQNVSVAGSKYKALSSAVIYGPNASGKTNLIGAMNTMQEILLRGHIRNSGEKTINQAANMLELIPFHGGDEAPTCFSIQFIEQGLLVEYSFSIRLGKFLNHTFDRYVESEKLYVNNNLVFDRGDTLTIDVSGIKQYLNQQYDADNLGAAEEIAQASLNKDELFFANGFKTIFAKELVFIISNWFTNKFVVIYRSDSLRVLHEFAGSTNKRLYVEKTLTEAAKEFGIHSNALGYVTPKENEPGILSSIINDGTTKAILPAEIYESYGTVRFVNEFPLIINALLNGGTLVMDEFDASIHPMALMNIINIFHNDEINIHHAQLIFNTHNPIFLNANLFRRDEIKFVERDEYTHASEHYSLSDFKTVGERGVRKGEDYMKNYFVNQYGAIKDVDFAPILEAIIHKEDKESNGE